MEKIEKIISKLPEELQPIARQYMAIFRESTEEQLDAWIDQVVDHNLKEAYRFLQEKLSNADIVAAQERIIEQMKEMNRKYITTQLVQKSLIKEALKIAILLLAEKI